MSEQVERRILDMLDHPTESPYGNPIPGLDAFGEAAAIPFTKGVVNIVTLVHGAVGSQTKTIRRLGEPAQVDPELLLQLKQSGIVPGATAAFTSVGSYVLVEVEGFGEGLELPNEVASHIFVGI